MTDFYNSREGYKIRLAWPVPNCAPNCPSAWIKDGYCDVACNTSLCLFDGGDCSGVHKKDEHIRWHPGNQFNSRNRLVSPSRGAQFSFNCAPGCADSWLGDHFCDSSCNNYDCGYDVGDCSLEDYHNLIKIESIPWVTNYLVSPTRVFYLTLTNFICPPSNIHYIKFERGKKIRAAVLSSKHEVLTIILHANESNTKLDLEIKCNLGANSSILPLNFIIRSDSHSNQRHSETNLTTIPSNDLANVRDPTGTNLDVNISLSSYSEPIPNSYTQVDILNRPSSLQSSWTLENPSSQEMSSASTLSSEPNSQGIYRHEKDRDLQKIGNMISNHEKYVPKGSHSGRHLLDTFSDSIVYVNYLYNKVYGVKNRKVPAHAPYFFNKHIIRRLWDKFSHELSTTSSHRIRSQVDMQFPFSYFYFLMNDNITIDAIKFIQKFDTDNSR